MQIKARIRSIILASRARHKLALIVAVSVLFASMMMASPVSATDYASTTRYFGLDKAYGVVGDTQTVGSPGNNYFSVQFYCEIWIAMVPEVYPAHISHLHVFVESKSSNQYTVDFVNTVYDHGAVVNWIYNPYNKPYLSQQLTSYTQTSNGIPYYVYRWAVTYGPTKNPLPGVPIHAYIEWWGDAVSGFTWSYAPQGNWKFTGKVISIALDAPEIWFNNW